MNRPSPALINFAVAAATAVAILAINVSVLRDLATHPELSGQHTLPLINSAGIHLISQWEIYAASLPAAVLLAVIGVFHVPRYILGEPLQNAFMTTTLCIALPAVSIATALDAAGAPNPSNTALFVLAAAALATLRATHLASRRRRTQENVTETSQ